MPVINNVAYSWSMITLSSTALGIEEGSTTLEGVSGIKWSRKRKIESNYGLGGKPVSRGFGNIVYEASITMLRSRRYAQFTVRCAISENSI